MDDSIFVFETFLRNNVFMTHLDNYITNSINECDIIETKSVPHLALQLIELLQTNMLHYKPKKKLSVVETYKLFELYRTYIISQLTREGIPNGFDIDEFNDIFNICIKLVVMKLTFLHTKN